MVEGGSAARAGEGAGGEKGTGAAQGSVAAEGGKGAAYRSKNDEVRQTPLLRIIKALQEELSLSRAGLQGVASWVFARTSQNTFREGRVVLKSSASGSARGKYEGRRKA